MRSFVARCSSASCRRLGTIRAVSGWTTKIGGTSFFYVWSDTKYGCRVSPRFWVLVLNNHQRTWRWYWLHAHLSRCWSQVSTSQRSACHQHDKFSSSKCPNSKNCPLYWRSELISNVTSLEIITADPPWAVQFVVFCQTGIPCSSPVFGVFIVCVASVFDLEQMKPLHTEVQRGKLWYDRSILMQLPSMAVNITQTWVRVNSNPNRIILSHLWLNLGKKKK